MKPSVFIAAALALSPLTLHAESEIIWGAKATFDVILPTKWKSKEVAVKMYKPGLGVTLGAICNIWLGHNFYLEPGASLFYDNYDYDDIVISNGNGNGYGGSIKSLYKIGLRVPVNVGYTFNFSDTFELSVYTGPQFSYAFAGDNRVNIEYLEEDIDFSLFGGFGSQRRFEMGWKVGVALPVGSWAIGVEGDFGITDILTGTFKCRENRVCLALTKYF